MVYGSLLEASLREIRAGTKAEQRREPGRTAEHPAYPPGQSNGGNTSPEAPSSQVTCLAWVKLRKIKECTPKPCHQ